MAVHSLSTAAHSLATIARGRFGEPTHLRGVESLLADDEPSSEDYQPSVKVDSDMATTHINATNFDSVVTAPGIVLVDFWAPWCAPCRHFGPIFERVSEVNPDVVFGKVNTEDEEELGLMLRIQSIPTLMVFRDGIPVFRQAGALPETALLDLLAQVRKLDMEEVRKAYEAAKLASSQGSGQAEA
jgi:thioredoxin 1